MTCQLFLLELESHDCTQEESMLTHKALLDLIVVLRWVVLFIQNVKDLVEAHLGDFGYALRLRRIFARHHGRRKARLDGIVFRSCSNR